MFQSRKAFYAGPNANARFQQAGQLSTSTVSKLQGKEKNVKKPGYRAAYVYREIGARELAGGAICRTAVDQKQVGRDKRVD